MTTYESELYHHGILGQKWGVRRYQNKDGSYTAAGKKRYNEEREEGSEKNKGLSKGAKTAIGVGAGLAAAGLAAAGLAAYALRNDVAQKAVGQIKEFATSEKTKEYVKGVGEKATNQLKDSAKNAGKAMVDAAMASVGAIAVSKLSKKFASNEGDSDAVKDRNKLLLDTTAAGVNAITKSNASPNSGGKKKPTDENPSKKIGDLRSVVGEPKGIHGYEDEKHYQEFFLDREPTEEQKSIIKAMRKEGYGVDQIESYVFHTHLYS